MIRQSNGLCKCTEIKDKVTYPNKALRPVTMMPSYQETVMESWYCYNDARIDIKSKEGNPQVEVMTPINLNL